MDKTMKKRQTVRNLAIVEATRQRLEMPEHWAFVCGAQSCADPGASFNVSEKHKASFNAGYEWAKEIV